PVLRALTICVVGPQSATVAEERPDALRELEAYRAALRTAHIEWSIVDHTAKFYRAETRFKTSKFAGDDIIIIERGDENGVVLRTIDGKVAEVGGTEPAYSFQTDGQGWHRMGDPLQRLNVYPRRPRVRDDLRALGAAAALVRWDIHDVIWRDPAPNPIAWKYHEWREGDLHVVRVRNSYGTKRFWLDPQRAWSPVRVRYQRDDGVWFESRSTLKKFDAVWFPETVLMFTSRYKEGREPAQIVRVYSATFNRPEHPQRLTPADIGVQVGMDVVVYDEDMSWNVGKWDGEKVVSFEEFAKRLHAGELKEGPNFIRAAVKASAKQAKERQAAQGPQVAGTPGWATPLTAEGARKALLLSPKQLESFWEAYTTAFIKKYKLNEEQTQKALSILKHCQQQAHGHVHRHKSEFDRLDERIKALRKLKGPERSKAEAQIRRDRETLLKPLDDIFEQQLKPRLDKLPTRAQRKDAEGRRSPKTPDKEGN
ncbi:MAG: hypothetical protein ACE5I3_13880, partial [Phycisphaerae bacterium]